jgi:hypothetical protein
MAQDEMEAAVNRMTAQLDGVAGEQVPRQDHARFWEAMRRPPESALKKINGGRLSGMTDISPQWRYRILTETFGPIGFGWTYSIERTWTERSEDTLETMAFCSVLLTVRDPETGEWSRPIPGIGGSMLVSQEQRGAHANDEAYKMATTDAISVAMKQLGVAADIYLGMWDGSKYREPDTDGPSNAGALAAAVSKMKSAKTLDELKGAFRSAFEVAQTENQKRHVIETKNRLKEALGAGNE